MSARRVLIIEDNSKIGRLVATELLEAGCTIDIRNDGMLGLGADEDSIKPFAMAELMARIPYFTPMAG